MIFLATVLVSCTHKPELITLPDQNTECDSINATYSKNIQPIFSTNCYSCHSTTAITTAGGGLDLEDTASLKNYLKSGFRGDGIYGSKLYHCMLHSPLAQQMPPTHIIDSCSLRKVHYWLSVGAPIK